MGASLGFNIRTQVTFTVSDRELAMILNGLAEAGVNINGYFQTIAGKRNFFVRMVVGTTLEETEYDLCTLHNVLRMVGVCYRENQVIQLLDPVSGVPGQLNAIFGTLWCRMQVRAVYLGEDSNIYLDVSNIGLALHLLSKENPPRCID